MATDVIGLFPTRDDAARAAQALERAGFSRADLRVESYSAEAEAKPETGWRRLLEWLHRIAPRPDAEFYSQGVRRGGTLVSVTAVTDAAAGSAVEILSRWGALNLGDRTAPYEASYRTGAPSPPLSCPPGQNQPTDTQVMDAAAIARLVGSPTPPPEGPGEAVAVSPQAAVPIVEEQLSVGPRPLGRGSVRVYRHLVEQPVEQEVILREERVTVDRRPVDRPVTERDAAFLEGVYEWPETEEQAVVSKVARVVEEVVVGKAVTRHTETIRDTVRHTEVGVEQPSVRQGEAR